MEVTGVLTIPICLSDNLTTYLTICPSTCLYCNSGLSHACCWLNVHWEILRMIFKSRGSLRRMGGPGDALEGGRVDRGRFLEVAISRMYCVAISRVA